MSERRWIPAALGQTSGERGFALAMLVNSLGNGVLLTVSALFFTRVVGMSLPVFGLVTALAAGCGLLAGPVIGHLADRAGPRRLYCLVLVVQGLGSLAYVSVDLPPVVGLLLCVVSVADRGAAATRGAFIALLVPRERRITYRAAVRALTNAGSAIGAAAGSAVLMVDTPTAYRIALAVNAVTYLLTAGVIGRTALPVAAAPSGPRAPSSPRTGTAMRDRPFLVITSLNAVLSLHGSMLTVGVPLWVAHRTDAPLWIISVVLVVNTVGVVFLQVPASRGVSTVADAARAGRRAALVLTSAGLMLAASGSTGGWVTVAVVLGATVLHLFGELWQAAAGWAFAFELAPEESMGQYQGVFNAGRDVGALCAPVLFTAIVAAPTWTGWLLPCGLFLLVALVLPPVTRWTERHRSRPVSPHMSPAG